MQIMGLICFLNGREKTNEILVFQSVYYEFTSCTRLKGLGRGVSDSLLPSRWFCCLE